MSMHANRTAKSGRGNDPKIAYCRVNPRWEVGLVSPSPTGQFSHVSFVNGVATDRGGTHVEAVCEQIEEEVIAAIARTDRTLKVRILSHVRVLGSTNVPNRAPHAPMRAQVTPAHVRSNMCLFINCLVENPSFDSQMKSSLTTPAADFGSSCKLPARFRRALGNDGSLVQRTLDAARERARLELRRESTRVERNSARVLLGIAKLEDARRAGTADRGKCTLILTEGDSAKALAVAGLSVVGRDHFGVFPLKGKVLNVRGMPLSRVLKNAEVSNLVKILGLSFSEECVQGDDSIWHPPSRARAPSPPLS